MFAKRMTKTAKKLTKKYGSSVVLNEPIGKSYNPATGLTEATYNQYPIKATTDINLLSKYPAELVQLGDVVILLSSNLAITREWTVNYDNKIWKILDIKKESAQDIDILKYLHLRS